MKRRRTSKSILLILFITAAVSVSFAQEPMKIGVVNSQLVLEKSQEGKKVTAQIESRNKSLQEDLARLDDKIRELETKLNTQRLTLNQEALNNLVSDIDKQRTDRGRFVEDSRREMAELTDRLFRRIQNELIPIIQQIGQEKNLDVVYDLGSSGIIYWNPAIDLTEEVIKKYDASKTAK
jgi:Skp family chaperone for outer membrane proteins